MNNVILLILILLILPVHAASARPGDRQVVTVEIANLRAGPATSYPVLLKLLKGRALTEVRRLDDWVEVDTGRTDVASGWVHASLLVQENHGNGIAADSTEEDPLFELFKRAFEELHAKLREKTGNSYFVNVESPGNRVIRLTVTEAWLELPRPQQDEILAEVFIIWDAALGDGLPITVDIIDQAGDRLMTKFR